MPSPAAPESPGAIRVSLTVSIPDMPTHEQHAVDITPARHVRRAADE
jgi:hypothetical protein